MTFDRYQMNLRYDYPFVYSYDTKVAKVEGSKLIELGWWSVTTQKHINYVAREMNLELVKS